MPRFTLALLLAAVAAPTLAQNTDVPTRVFTGADLFDLEQASDPQIGPDGRTVAYVGRSGDVMADRMRPSIWLVDVATAE